MMDLDPITRIMYWSDGLRAEWEPRISRISSAYAKTELETFMRDSRDIYIYHVRSDNFDQSYEMLRENDLLYYPNHKSALYEGFSHKHITPQPGDPYMLYGAVVKRAKKDIGKQFLEADSSTSCDHEAIGKLLGYPNCCTSFFSKTFGPVVDPIYEAAMNTENKTVEGNTVTLSSHPYCNQMLRYFGLRITPHLTHSMDCKKSIEMGMEWFSVMTSIDRHAARWAAELLSMPLTWDCYKGIAIIDTPIFRGMSNSDFTRERRVVINSGWESKLKVKRPKKSSKSKKVKKAK